MIQEGRQDQDTSQMQINYYVQALLLTRGWRQGDLMVIVLVSGSSSPGSSPGLGHCVVFLDKTLDSHSASLHPGVLMGTGKFNSGGNPAVD